MSESPVKAMTPESLEGALSGADDRVLLNNWLPPQVGVVPKIRIGRRWINVLWALPLVFVLGVIGVAVAQALRELPAVQEFLVRYPGASPSAPAVAAGFPAWLRVQHFLNLLFMAFIIRAGIQVLADHPRLYWKRDCTPGTEWFRFQKAVPKGRIWTAKDDSVTLPGWLGIPGIRHSIGLARWWHFSFGLLWIINGIVVYALLFWTDQWLRLVPTTWEVFPNAASTALQYLSLTFPADESWTRYNSLQQLAYFITVFVAAPVSLVHVTLVFITGARVNLNMMFAGVNDRSWSGFAVFIPAMALVAVTWWLASPFTIRHARVVQKVGEIMMWPFNALTEWWDPNSQLAEKDISPYFWPNGTMPKSAQFDALVAEGFASFVLRVGGLVESPRAFTYAELKAMPKQEQITTHFCIQGWSGVAKWGGVPMRHILELVRPTSEARYAVFYSLADGSDVGRYYDVHKISNMRHNLTILAYEMNGAPVSVLHGAPLRLRCENELGFKMVKWIAAIEFVHDFADLGAGQGGYNEDHEFYGYRMPI